VDVLAACPAARFAGGLGLIPGPGQTYSSKCSYKHQIGALAKAICKALLPSSNPSSNNLIQATQASARNTLLKLPYLDMP
jgi:hypothetical protein